MYTQSQQPWSSSKIGSSGLSMAADGCLITANSYAFALAGYVMTPGDMLLDFEDAGAITSGGLLSWYKIGGFFPQYAFLANAGGQYKFVEVFINGSATLEHWLLLANGTYYDPLTGLASAVIPSNYKTSYKNSKGVTVTGVVYSANIKPAPVNVPVQVVPTAQTLDMAGHSGPFWIKTTAGINVRTKPILETDDAQPAFFLKANSPVLIDGYVEGSMVLDVHGNPLSNRWCYSDAHKLYFSAYYTREVENAQSA